MRGRSLRRRSASVAAGAAVLASLLVPVEIVTSSSVADAATQKPVVGAADVASARLAAAKQGARVEITNDRSPSSTTYANPDGTFTTDTSAGPVRAMTVDGWKAIDPSLVSDGHGRLQPKVAAAALSLSADGSGDAASLTNGKKSLHLDWASALSAPTVSGAEATYNLGGGTSLRLVARADGFEASVVLSRRPGNSTSWSLPLSATGLTATSTADGGADLADSSGTSVFAISAPHMFDATRDVAGDPTREGPVAMTVTGTAPNQALKLTPSSDFLSDPGTVYPVTVDPTFTTVNAGRAADTFISSADPNTSYTGSYRLRAGFDGTSVYRSFVGVTLPNLTGKHFMSASLILHQYYAASCTAKTTTEYPPTTSHADETWNTQPAVNTGYGASASFNYGGATCNSGNPAIDVTSTYGAWLSGAVGEHGLELRGGEADSLSEKRFCSMNVDVTLTYCNTYGVPGQGGTEPTLQVTYNSYPGTPTGQATNPPVACATGASRPFIKTKTPTLNVKVTDADGGNVQGGFQVWHTGGTQIGTETLGSSAPAGGMSAYAVPASFALADGSTYSWKARGYDGTDYGSAYSSWCEFTVDTTLPSAPTVSSTAYPSGGWSAPGADATLNLAATDGGSGVDHYLYSALTSAGPNMAPPNLATGTDDLLNTTGYTAGANVTIGSSTDTHYQGSRSLIMGLGSAVAQYQALVNSDFLPVIAGQAYAFSGYLGLNSNVPSLYAEIQWYDANKTAIPGGSGLTYTDGNVITAPASVTTARSAAHGTAPTGAVYARLLIKPAAANTAGTSVYAYTDGWQFEQASAATSWVTTPDPVLSNATGSGGSSVQYKPMPNGWHLLAVAAVDKAGNTGPTTYSSFGSAAPSLTAPADGTVTAHSVLLGDSAKPAANGAGYVTYYYRRADTDNWARIPAADVTITSSGTALTAWPYNYTSSGDTGVAPRPTWNVAATMTANGKTTDGPVQIAGCVGTACPAGPLSTLPAGSTDNDVTVTLDTHSFDVAATGDLTPGAVNLLTGNFQLSAGDVSVPGNQGGDLSVGRTFNTATVASTDGIFGPGWSPSLPVDDAGVDYTGLADTGSVLTATYSDQSTISFGQTSTGQYAPTGPDADSGLSATVNTADCEATYRCYEIDDLDHNRAIFQSVSANPPTAGTTSAPVAYRLVKVVEPATADITTFSYANGLVSQITAPIPTGATCTDPTAADKWTAGCRGLALAYDSHNHLTAVTYLTNPGTGPLSVDVACYSYEQTSPYRLTDEWDPRDIPTAATGSHPISCGSPVRPSHYDYDSTSGRVTKVTPAYTATTPALAGWQIGYDNTGRVTTITRTHLDGSGSEISHVFYGIALTPGTDAAPYRPDLTTAATTTWGQTDVPDGSAGATAICPPGATVTDAAGDLRDCRLTYLDADGRTVNTADYAGSGLAGWHISSTEYDPLGHDVRELSAANREEALSPSTGAGKALGLPTDTAQAAMDLSTINVYTANSRDGQPDLTASFGPYHQVQLPDGSIKAARAYSATTYDESTGDTFAETGHPVDAQSHPTSLHLPVKTVTAASLSPDAVATALTDTRETDSMYYTSADSTSGWTYSTPLQTIADPAGLAITTTSELDASSGRVTYTRMPSAAGDTAHATAGTTKTIYYMTGANSQDAACGNKPQWDGQVCVTAAANTTPTTGLPSLVTTRYVSYDYLGRPTEVDETATPSGGSAVTRVTTSAFGFNSTMTGTTSANPYASTSEYNTVSGGVGTTVPAQTTSYANGTGLPTGVSNGTVADATGYDDFGRPASYNENTTATSALANPVTTSYEATTGRLHTTADAHTTQTYTYNGGGEHRGLPTNLAVTVNGTTSYAGTFTAAYGADGAVTSQTDPTSVTTALTRDETGQLTALADTKSGAAWVSDTVTPSVYGQWRTHVGPAGHQTYSYDAAGRLTEADDATGGGACAIRAYSFTGTYGADSNRYSSTVYPAAGDGSCQSAKPYTGGVSTSHSYDAADRLLAAGNDAGLAYDAFGRITTLPSNDTSNAADETVGYYSNDLVRSETQGTTVQTWTLDPEQRLDAWTVATGGTTASSSTSHYDDASSDSPDWTTEAVDGAAWTANVADLLGSLAVTVDQTGAATYSYANLHGDVAATAAAGATTPTVAPDYDEFGNNPPIISVDDDGNTVITPADNPRYGWLGGKQRAGDDQAGLIVMGVRLYDPSLGRFLQTDPVPGGSANLYDYAGQDPVNVFDLDGRQWRADVEGCGAGPDIGEGLSAADRDAGWGQNTPPRGSSRSRWSPPRFSSTRRKDVGYTSEWAKSQHQAFGKADFQWRHGGGRATFRGTHGGPRGPHVHVEFKDRGGKIYHVHHIYYPRGL
jgi:RHS repeat-associated protein